MGVYLSVEDGEVERSHSMRRHGPQLLNNTNNCNSLFRVTKSLIPALIVKTMRTGYSKEDDKRNPPQVSFHQEYPTPIGVKMVETEEGCMHAMLNKHLVIVRLKQVTNSKLIFKLVSTYPSYRHNVHTYKLEPGTCDLLESLPPPTSTSLGGKNKGILNALKTFNDNSTT